MRVDADITRLALKLAPLVCVRPGELRQAQWADVDLENAQWRIGARHMNGRRQLELHGGTRAVGTALGG